MIPDTVRVILCVGYGWKYLSFLECWKSLKSFLSDSLKDTTESAYFVSNELSRYAENR